MDLSSREFLETVRRAVPRPVKRMARGALSTLRMIPPRVRLTVGVHPVNAKDPRVYDRGMPIDRYYLEAFLQECAPDIRGHCLEFFNDAYTSRFGGEKVTTLDILHKEPGNPRATIVADLTRPNAIPSNAFDCIICTYVLHSIFELETAVSELHRILKPGGVLLVAVPHIAKYLPHYTELWRFTPEGLHGVLARAFAAERVTVHAYGNSLTAVGFLRGLAAHEFTRAELAFHDPGFPVGLFARAWKPS